MRSGEIGFDGDEDDSARAVELVRGGEVIILYKVTEGRRARGNEGRGWDILRCWVEVGDIEGWTVSQTPDEKVLIQEKDIIQKKSPIYLLMKMSMYQVGELECPSTSVSFLFSLYFVRAELVE